MRAEQRRRSSACATAPPPAPRKRQRNSSRAEGLGRPSGQTLMPRLVSIVSLNSGAGERLRASRRARRCPGSSSRRRRRRRPSPASAAAARARPRGRGGVCGGAPRSATALSFCGFWPSRATTASANSFVPTFCLLTPSVEDVVGVDAVLDRPQPGVVDALGDVGLADVDQHHHRAEQQARGVRQVLARAPRRRAVDRLEHRAAARRCWPSRRGPTEPAICAATSERMSP